MSETKGARPLREEQRPARQEVEEVTPGVLRIQLPISLPGLGHVNCYAMEDRRGITLVDPGLPGIRTWRHLKKQLKSVDLSVNQVHTVVVTHSHPDHFGQVGRFRKAGAEIVTHRSFRTFLDPEAEADDEEMVTVLDNADPSAPANTTPDPQGAACGHQHHQSGPQGPNRPATPFPTVTPWGGKAV